ncbi:MAG: MATE family efflux transporter, partial [Deltaproteobacteria bacterium]|nr:MATE family efflux transporter [Deltaproteobacteria bacterium]
MLRLAVPLCAAQLGMQLMTLVDVAVVGRLGAVPLAAVGLASGLYLCLFVLGMGVMMGLEPLLSQAVGAGQPLRARQLYWQGVALAGAITLALTPVALLLPLPLTVFGIEPEVARGARDYLWIRHLGTFPSLLLLGARGYLQALGTTRPFILAAVVANVLNVGAVVLFVFGGEVLPAWCGPLRGWPAWGVGGAAVATVLATGGQLAVLLPAVKALKVDGWTAALRRPDRPSLARALQVGLPVGLQLFAEVVIFALAGVLAGRMGATAAATHQLAITLASASFMVAVGLGGAGSVRVGLAVGAGDGAGARRAGVVALGVAGAFMAGAAVGFWLFPRPLAWLLTDDAALVEAALPLLAVTAAFQVSDGLQAVGSA